MKPRIVLIGAGSAMFGLGAIGDIIKSKVLDGCTIVLNDINEASLTRVEYVTRKYVEEHKLSHTVIATTERKKALEGADFCIISIEIGNRYTLWEQDWRMAQQFGIPQVYGENGGPGGIFHALRIIPSILDICADINSICPNAYVINLSNPMSIICLAVSKKFPQLKLVGLCHEVVSLVDHIPAMLGRPYEDLELISGGLNHFSILVSAKDRKTGQDLYPQILKLAPEYYKNMPERGLFREIVRLYDAVPNTTDSHFGEYIQWAQELVDHKGIMDFYTSYMRSCTTPIDEYARIDTGTNPEEYWRVVNIIEGILTDTGHFVMAVNIRNDGCIDGIPDHIVVEVPATVDAKGIHGIKLEHYNQGILGLLQNRVGVLDLTTEAILQKSKKLVLQALLCEPVVNSAVRAEKLLDMMLSYQAEYLDYLK